jgi:hypothetical protein
MGEDKGGGEKELTTSLTLTLSRKGRERRKKIKKVSSRASSPLTGEDKGGGEKELTAPLTLTLSRKGEREAKENDLINSPHLNPSPERGDKISSLTATNLRRVAEGTAGIFNLIIRYRIFTQGNPKSEKDRDRQGEKNALHGFCLLFCFTDNLSIAWIISSMLSFPNSFLKNCRYSANSQFPGHSINR